MIQNIFLPEKLGTYYIFSQRIVGISITKTHIYATVVIASGSVTSIEKSLVEHLQADKPNHAERVIETLTSIIKKVGAASQINVALPSSVVVFKELRLPFYEYDKLNKVIRFEVEPLLPFSTQDAVIDFIMTDRSEKGEGTQLLVAATQKQTIAEQLSLFEQAHSYPTVITVDMICLYGLYTQIPAYQSLQGIIILLDIDIQSTRLIIIHNQQLRIIRTLPHGIYQIAKTIGNGMQMSPQQIMDHLVRFGLEKSEPPELVQGVQTNLAEFFGKIQFALNSTISQLNESKITKLLITGAGAEIKGMSSFAQEKLQAPCELFDIKKLTKNERYTITSKADITQAGMVSVAAAITSPITHAFNLRRETFERINHMLMFKQLITTGILVFSLFSLLITHSIIQIRRLNKEIEISKNETIKELKNRFTEIPEDSDDLDEVLEEAKSALTKEESIWLAFSSQTRVSFLEYLLELSSRINKQELGFVPEQITITDGVKGEISLKAKVRDYPALTLLEKSLSKSKLFSYVEGQKTPDFIMKILISRNQ